MTALIVLYLKYSKKIIFLFSYTFTILIWLALSKSTVSPQGKTKLQ